MLGYCLNVLGVDVGPNRQRYGGDSFALAVAVQSWARKRYLWLRQQNVEVAAAVLIGRLSFEEADNRLVITYFKGLNREVPRTYLALDPPDASEE
jgi:hypothetical protein